MIIYRVKLLGQLLILVPTIRGRSMHLKCRNTERPYPRSDVFRLMVPDDKVSWSTVWSNYSPQDYTSKSVIGKPWADTDDLVNGNLAWNKIDGQIDRRSHIGNYQIDENGRPLNPEGRTGVCGRGVLGKWGPNHAVDPIVSRTIGGKLQFVGIERRDSGQWAIPGGMIDNGENALQALQREFVEEALDGQFLPELQTLWASGVELYRGYVDDPRNTDNAWMETVVVNFHDTEEILKKVVLKAGDDAAKVRWITATEPQSLYASHEYFIKLLCERHKK